VTCRHGKSGNQISFWRSSAAVTEGRIQAALPPGGQSILAETPVITRFSPTNVNLHRLFLPIIKRAGLTPWPKLIQNLRASCETEWLDSGMPAHVVANWFGHSVKVQNDN
jgi:hypothetical protein